MQSDLFTRAGSGREKTKDSYESLRGSGFTVLIDIDTHHEGGHGRCRDR